MIKQVALLKKYEELSSKLRALLMHSAGDARRDELNVNVAEFAKDSIKKLVGAKSEFELAASGIGDISQDEAVLKLVATINMVERSLEEISAIKVKSQGVEELTLLVEHLSAIDREVADLTESLVKTEKNITKKASEELTLMLDANGNFDVKKIKEEKEKILSELEAKKNLVNILKEIKRHFAEDAKTQEAGDPEAQLKKAFSQFEEVLSSLGVNFVNPEESKKIVDKILKDGRLAFLFGQSDKSGHKHGVGSLGGFIKANPFFATQSKEEIGELLKKVRELDSIFDRTGK